MAAPIPFYQYLIPALWLAWLAYWLYAARDAKPTERIEQGASRALHTIPLAIAAYMLASGSLPGGWLGGTVVPWSPALYFSGAAIVAAGLAFAISARVHLGRNWSGIVTLKRDHELVRGGPYSLVRHPIYTGLLLGFAGSAIARDEWRGVLAFAIAVAALWRKLSIEEAWMIERFGDAYRRYRAEVPALIPRWRGPGRP